MTVAGCRHVNDIIIIGDILVGNQVGRDFLDIILIAIAVGVILCQIAVSIGPVVIGIMSVSFPQIVLTNNRIVPSAVIRVDRVLIQTNV